MKQLYFFISFLFVTQISTSQSLIDTTKLWNEVECFSGPFVACQTKSYKFQGDTVINSYQYKKLFFTLDTLLMNWSLTGAIREVGQKVYYNNFNNADYLLYDFAANVGDTIEPISFCLSNYLIADSVDTVIVNGSPRRRLIFNFMPCLYTEEWIEGMGSTHGIVNRLIVYGDLPADYGTELLCFWQNDTINWINQSYNDCYVTFGIGIDEQNKGYEVFIHMIGQHFDNIWLYSKGITSLSFPTVSTGTPVEALTTIILF